MCMCLSTNSHKHVVSIGRELNLSEGMNSQIPNPRITKTNATSSLPSGVCGLLAMLRLFQRVCESRTIFKVLPRYHWPLPVCWHWHWWGKQWHQNYPCLSNQWRCGTKTPPLGTALVTSSTQGKNKPVSPKSVLETVKVIHFILCLPIRTRLSMSLGKNVGTTHPRW